MFFPRVSRLVKAVVCVVLPKSPLFGLCSAALASTRVRKESPRDSALNRKRSALSMRGRPDLSQRSNRCGLPTGTSCVPVACSLCVRPDSDARRPTRPSALRPMPGALIRLGPPTFFCLEQLLTSKRQLFLPLITPTLPLSRHSNKDPTHCDLRPTTKTLYLLPTCRTTAPKERQ